MDKRVNPNREEPFFIIISTIIIVIDLRVIGIDKNEQERISRHFTDNCVQRRVFCFFFLSVMACQHTSIFRRDSSNLR